MPRQRFGLTSSTLTASLAEIRSATTELSGNYTQPFQDAVARRQTAGTEAALRLPKQEQESHHPEVRRGLLHGLDASASSFDRRKMSTRVPHLKSFAWCRCVKAKATKSLPEVDGPVRPRNVAVKAAGVAQRAPTAQPPAMDLGGGVCASGLNGLSAGGLEGLKSVSTDAWGLLTPSKITSGPVRQCQLQIAPALPHTHLRPPEATCWQPMSWQGGTVAYVQNHQPLSGVDHCVPAALAFAKVWSQMDAQHEHVISHPGFWCAAGHVPGRSFAAGHVCCGGNQQPVSHRQQGQCFLLLL